VPVTELLVTLNICDIQDRIVYSFIGFVVVVVVVVVVVSSLCAGKLYCLGILLLLMQLLGEVHFD
jgi:hypothetical protein